jgi:DNA polymerase III subunit epsilon
VSFFARLLGNDDGDTPLSSARIVVADVETSGLDPYRDRLISIGAVAVMEGLVRFDDSFSIVLRQPDVSPAPNILVHGIDGATQLAGAEPPDALAQWLRFAGTSPLAGFHADFDRVVLERASRAFLGERVRRRWLDVAFLVPALFPQPAQTLDDWLRVFGIEAYARHDALADALATAQLFQIVLAEAARRGLRTLGALRGLQRDQRTLARY